MKNNKEKFKINNELYKLVEPLVSSEGLFLLELDWRGEKKENVLRLIVDRIGGGITLDVCASLSRQVSFVLDVSDFFDQKYRLEVSSPGVSRIFKGERDYKFFTGRFIKMRVKNSEGNVEDMEGILKGLREGIVLLEKKEKLFSVSLKEVISSKLSS